MMIIQTSLGETCMSLIVWLWTWQLWDSKPNWLIIFTHLHGYEKANWIQSIIKKVNSILFYLNLVQFELNSIKLWKEIQFDLIWIQFNQIQFNWI
jgi:hypothetical protein